MGINKFYKFKISPPLYFSTPHSLFLRYNYLRLMFLIKLNRFLPMNMLIINLQFRDYVNSWANERKKPLRLNQFQTNEQILVKIQV